MIKICTLCEKTYQHSSRKSKYCGKECYYQMKRLRGDRVRWTEAMKIKASNEKLGSLNPQFGKKPWNTGKRVPNMTGTSHPRWKGGFWINEDGYRVIENLTETGDGRKLEHRMVMEKHLGRELCSEEIVHHINGDKLDNRIENLEIVTRSQHIGIHRKDLLEAKNYTKKKMKKRIKEVEKLHHLSLINAGLEDIQPRLDWLEEELKVLRIVLRALE